MRLRLPRASKLTVLVLPVAALACSGILGIDGKYVISHEETATEAGVSTGGSGGSGDGGSESDGSSDGGGGGSTGGSGTGGAPRDAGPDSPPLLATCRPGLYQGKFSGFHSPSWTVVGVPLPLNGDVTLRLGSSEPNRLDVVSGKLSGQLALPSGFTNLTASFTGSIDCGTGELSGAAISGDLGPVSVEGQLTGTLDRLSVSGGWSEAEVTPKGPSPLYNGKGGGWNATWVKP